jgi:hypothetical protein
MYRVGRARRLPERTGRNGKGRCRQQAALGEPARSVQHVRFLALPPATCGPWIARDRVSTHRSPLNRADADHRSRCSRCGVCCLGQRHIRRNATTTTPIDQVSMVERDDQICRETGTAFTLGRLSTGRKWRQHLVNKNRKHFPLFTKFVPVHHVDSAACSDSRL